MGTHYVYPCGYLWLSPALWVLLRLIAILTKDLWALLLFLAHIHSGCHQYMQIGEEFPRPSNSIVRQPQTEARGIQQDDIRYKVANIARTS